MRTWISSATALAIACSMLGSAAGQKFYKDDPIWQDPETQDASSVKRVRSSQWFDFAENTFTDAGDQSTIRAVNVNTIDEVPDSSWFENRIGRESWTAERVAQGADTGSGPAPGTWTVIEAKSEGITPGLTIKDSRGDTYFVKFDPPWNPEMATGAEVICTKFFYAFGYHTPQNYLATLEPANLTIAPGTVITDVDNRERPMKLRDIHEVLEKTAKNADGTYRVVASFAIPGTPIGKFKYHGTRPDDPNDIHPHEHRRELRGMLPIAAWLNHDDSRSINTHDVLLKEGGRALVKHYLLDFGSTLGSGSTHAQTARASHEYIWEARPTFLTLATMGLYIRPWLRAKYPDLPSVGRYESDFFTPENWKPEYPNPAFRNARPDDTFWAARIISRMSDDAIRAVVATAKYSNPEATKYMTDTLIARKRKVVEHWLNATNPVVNPSLSASGALTFENAAVEAGVAKPAERYTLVWSRLDNATGTHTFVGGEQTVTTTAGQAPPELLRGGDYISVTIRGYQADRAGWRQPVFVYFRRAADGWSLVGLERDR